MSRRYYTAAQIAAEIGKSENWVKRNARNIPHTRFGRTYCWDDADLAALREMFRRRPDAAGVDALRPVQRRRRSA